MIVCRLNSQCLAIPEGGSPSLAEVLAVVNVVRCIDCGVVIEGEKSADGEGVCDPCWQKFGKEVRDWINDKEGEK